MRLTCYKRQVDSPRRLGIEHLPPNLPKTRSDAAHYAAQHLVMRARDPNHSRHCGWPIRPTPRAGLPIWRGLVILPASPMLEQEGI